ncbi:MAG: hypothetical protein HFJ05_00435 [Eubacterium sp.]|nr:hypothetical protein [Eubacterium sp.]
MNQVAQAETGYAAMAAQHTAADKTNKKGEKSRVTNGATIGTPELSDKAKKYYEQLRKKYANMDFILVSEDKKAEAQANVGRYANANRMVVLIDTEKIERMAEDEDYRRKYEAIIQNASPQMAQLKQSLGENGAFVKTYGMQMKDNGAASFFAVIDKSLMAQKARIQKNAAKKAEEKKEAKKALEEKRAENRKAKRKEDTERPGFGDDADTVTVTASSVEELIQKINSMISMGMSDYVRTEEETWVGGRFDFSI